MQRTYCVFNQTGESFVALNVRRAETALAQLKGMLRQLRTKSNEGLWAVPSRGILTISLLAPVDLIYLDAQNEVIGLVEHLGPFRIAPIFWNSASVLQLPPHTIYSSQTHMADKLLICSPGEMEDRLKKAGPPINMPEGSGLPPAATATETEGDVDDAVQRTFNERRCGTGSRHGAAAARSTDTEPGQFRDVHLCLGDAE
jgi:hypothetical protein